MNRLIIEGIEADLRQGNININFQINDLGDVSTRNSTFSNTIDLPRTSNNEAIFKMLNLLGSSSRVPYEKLRCTFIQNNITLINNGYLQLNEVNEDSFKCNIFDGIIDLAEKLKGKTLANLNMGSINLTMSSFLSSFNNTSNYIYALAHYDKAYPITIFNNTIWEITKQAPSLFVHSVFDKIITGAGFTYEGEVFDDEEFKTEVITMSKGFDAINKSKLANIGSNTLQGFMGNHYGKRSHNLNTLDTPTEVTVKDSRITANANISLVLNFQIYSITRSAIIEMEIVKNGVVAQSFDIQAARVYEKTISLVAGDYIEIKSGARISGGGASYFKNSFDLRLNKSLGAPVVDLAPNMDKDITQVDFLKDVMQRYGLIMKTDSTNSNHLKFIPLEDLLNDKDNAIDLTDRFDRTLSTNYNVGYAKVNTAEYQYVDKDAEAVYDGKMLVVNDNINSIKPLFKSPLMISTKEFESDAYSEPIPVYDVFLWDGKLEKDESNVEFFNYSNLETKARLFKLDTLLGDRKYSYYNSPHTTVTSTPILTLKNVSMQYYLNNYYPSFNDLIDNYKEVKVKMKLDTIDLLKMDFFKLVYLKQFQAYFYLQGFNNNGEVTLLQIKNI